MKFLFDLGGVFFDWNPKYVFKDIFESKEELSFFLNKVCNDEWNISKMLVVQLLKLKMNLL